MFICMLTSHTANIYPSNIIHTSCSLRSFLVWLKYAANDAFDVDAHQLRSQDSASVHTPDAYFMCMRRSMHDLAFIVCVCARVFLFFAAWVQRCCFCLSFAGMRNYCRQHHIFFVENLELTISQYTHDTIILAHKMYALQFSLKSKIID